MASRRSRLFSRSKPNLRGVLGCSKEPSAIDGNASSSVGFAQYLTTAPSRDRCDHGVSRQRGMTPARAVVKRPAKAGGVATARIAARPVRFLTHY